MKILANDGISQSGIDALSANGFEVITVNVAQEQLIEYKKVILDFNRAMVYVAE